MNIGITYDLRSDYLEMGFSEEETAEFDREDTIIAIEQSLAELGHQTERIGHVKQLVSLLSQGRRWDIVFNISEGMHGTGREAQVPALLDAYQIPYVFSGPLVLALTLDKGLTKRVIRDAGLATPDFRVIRRPSDIDEITLPFPLFVKPLAEGTGKGIDEKAVVYNLEELKQRCADLWTNFSQPLLVETYLNGREFTTGITGTGDKAMVTGSMEIVLLDAAEKGVYSYRNKEECENLIEYRSLLEEPLKAQCENLALASYRLLGCEDAGRVDLRLDANGVPHFLEINPLAGLHPEHSDLPILSRLNGVAYQDLIHRIMQSALQKVSK